MNDTSARNPAADPRGAGAPNGVGPTLRARREQLGWALPDVATWLRIRLSYLEAMEDGRVKDLPGNVYTVGFLRTYAQALGLDAESLVARFKAEARDNIDYKPELSFPAPVPGSAVPAGVMALLGGVVIIAAYVGWYRMTGVQSVPPQQVPSVYSAIPGMTRQAPTSPQVASVLPSGRPIGPPQPLSNAERSAITDGDVPAPAPLAAPTPAVPPQGTTPQGAVTQGTVTQGTLAQGNGTPGVGDAAVPPPAGPSQSAMQPVPQPAPVAAAPPTAPAGQMMLTASAQTWVQVRVAGGPVIYDHILQPGESWSVPPDRTNLLLTVGNAGGLVLSADGVTTQPLGRNGAVVRNLSLTPDAIRSGSIVTAASTPAPHAARPHGSGAGAAMPASAPAVPQATPPSPTIAH